MKKLQPTPPLSPREITWGTRYLLFSICFLGPLIQWILKQWYVSDSAYLDLIHHAINLVATVFIFRHFLWNSLQQASKLLRRILLVGAIALIVYLLVVVPLETIIEYCKPDFINQNKDNIENNLTVNPWITTFSTIALVPISEELLYRGLVFGAIRKKNRLLAYVVSVFLFAAIHVLPCWSVEPLSFVVYIPAGLILALAYDISGSIITPIFMHTAINTIAMLYRK